MSAPPSEVAYGEHSLQKVKLFHYSPTNAFSLIFVHGGAWRDPANTYDDFQSLSSMLLRTENGSKYNIIGVNYRLSPEVKHPLHLLDLVEALNTLHKDYGVNECLLLGHSVGATLLMQLANATKILLLGGIEKNMDPLVKVKGMIFVDGIYDMVYLIEEYGKPYEEFVLEAFANANSYANGSQLSWNSNEKFGIGEAKVVVIHSMEDELLTLRQTTRFAKFLDDQNVPYKLHTGNWGTHEEVYRRKELAELVSDYCVKWSQSGTDR